MTAMDRLKRLVPGHMVVAASAWISRIVGAVVQLAVVRILLSELGSHQYAVYVLLTSLTGWYLLTDLGIGASLQNYISEQRAKGQEYRDYVVTAASMMLGITVLVVVLLAVVTPVIAPRFLHQFDFLSPREMKLYFLLSGLILMSTAASSLVYRIWYAEHKGYLSNVFPAVSSLVGLALVFLVLKYSTGQRLIACLAAFTLPSLAMPLTALALKVWAFTRAKGKFSYGISRLLVSRAARFFVFTLMGLLITQVDYMVLSQTVNAHEITLYNITTKLFTFTASMYSAVLAAFTPPCAEMYVRKDYDGIRNYTKKHLALGFLMIICFTAFFAVFKDWIVNVLSPRESVVPSLSLIILMGSYYVVRIWTDTYATLLVSINKFKYMLFSSIVQILLSIGLQSYLSVRYGVRGLVAGVSASYILTAVWWLPLVTRKYIEKREATTAGEMC